MKKTILKCFMIILGISISLAASAQVTTSSMSGKISDPAGNGVPGATVIAVHTPTGSQYYSVADAKGNYRILNILPGGPYAVRVEMLGYQKTEFTGIEVALADNFVLNATIREESLNLNEVVVVAESRTSNMRSDRAGAVTSLNTRAINSLPVISRDIEGLVKLTPQAFSGSKGPQIGGGTYRQNNFSIDGAASNNAFGIGQSMPANGSPISMDAIEQISVNVTPFDVRQSGFIGAAMNAVTRSGKNHFEASAYSYFYNQDFRGDRVGDETLSLNDEQHFIVGARVGGPIVKNRLFFFLNWEMQRDTRPGPSALAATPDHPYTDGKDGVARPKAGVMDAIHNYLVDNYKYNPGAYEGYSALSPGMKVLARLDWNINKDHKLNLRYNMTNSKGPSGPSGSTSGLADGSFSPHKRYNNTALAFENARYFQEQNYSSAVLELNSRFQDGRLNNVLRATYSHQYEPRSVAGNGEFPFVDIAVKNNPSDTQADIYTSFGTELFSYGNLRDVNTVNVTDEFTASLGAHSLLAGLQYEWNRTKNGFQRFGAGYYTFIFDSEEQLMASMQNRTLFDNPYQYAITHSFKDDYSQAFPQFDFHQVSLYLQDEMTFNRFKLSVGLRVELPMYPSLDYNYNEQVANTVFADYKGNGGKYDTRQLPSTSVMFSPRVGFNWDILGNRDLVLRGGTGLFTGRLPFVWIVAQAGDSGVIQSTYTAKQGGSDVLPSFHTNRIDALNEIFPQGPNAGQSPIRSISLMAPDLKMPQTWKTSLALDYVIPGDVLFSVEGIFNYDVNPVTITNVGLKDPVKSNMVGFADNRPIWGGRYDNKLRDAYLLHNADLNGYYYSVTAKFEKKNFYGFDGLIAYTYSGAQSLDDGYGDQVYSAWKNSKTVNGQNIHDLGYASYVMPHRLIASLSYKAEYAKNFATGISLFYEGGPRGRYSYTYTNNIVGDRGENNLIYVPKTADELTFKDYSYFDENGTKQVYSAESQAVDFWEFVNNSKYLSTRKGMYAERNGLVAPWTHQFDVRIFQDFYINCRNGQRNTIQVGLDIRNIGNLFSRNCGHFYSVNETSILKVVSGYGAGGNSVDPAPTYNFVRNGVNVLKDEFRHSVGVGSTWMMQLSLRYIFK